MTASSNSFNQSILNGYPGHFRFFELRKNTAWMSNFGRAVAHHALIHAYCTESQPLKAPEEILDDLHYVIASCAKTSLSLRLSSPD